MAIEQISEAKRLALKAEILRMTKEGKNFRQVARMAKAKFNVKLTINKNGKSKTNSQS